MERRRDQAFQVGLMIPVAMRLCVGQQDAANEVQRYYRRLLGVEDQSEPEVDADPFETFGIGVDHGS